MSTNTFFDLNKQILYDDQNNQIKIYERYMFAYTKFFIRAFILFLVTNNFAIVNEENILKTNSNMNKYKLTINNKSNYEKTKKAIDKIYTKIVNRKDVIVLMDSVTKTIKTSKIELTGKIIFSYNENKIYAEGPFQPFTNSIVLIFVLISKIYSIAKVTKSIKNNNILFEFQFENTKMATLNYNNFQKIKSWVIE